MQNAVFAFSSSVFSFQSSRFMFCVLISSLDVKQIFLLAPTTFVWGDWPAAAAAAAAAAAVNV